MQVNINNIQRPTLIEPFLNEELTPDNEFLTYIDCTTNLSNTVHKNNGVTSNSHNIKKSLKTKKFNVALSLKYNNPRWYFSTCSNYMCIDGKDIYFNRNHLSLQTA